MPPRKQRTQKNLLDFRVPKQTLTTAGKDLTVLREKALILWALCIPKTQSCEGHLKKGQIWKATCSVRGSWA